MVSGSTRRDLQVRFAGLLTSARLMLQLPSPHAAFMYAFLKGVTYSLFFWLPFYLSAAVGLSVSKSAQLSTFYEVGFLTGALWWLDVSLFSIRHFVCQCLSGAILGILSPNALADSRQKSTMVHALHPWPGGFTIGIITDRVAFFVHRRSRPATSPSVASDGEERPIRCPVIVLYLIVGILPLLWLSAARSIPSLSAAIFFVGVCLGGPGEAATSSVSVDLGR